MIGCYYTVAINILAAADIGSVYVSSALTLFILVQFGTALYNLCVEMMCKLCVAKLLLFR